MGINHQGLTTDKNSCIEHYLALIAACMPTLGPFFRYLRPSRLKRMAKGHKSLADDAEGVWSRPGTLDHSLMYGSVLVSQGRDNEAAFENSTPSLPPKAHVPRVEESVQEPSMSGKEDLESAIELHETISR